MTAQHRHRGADVPGRRARPTLLRVRDRPADRLAADRPGRRARRTRSSSPTTGSGPGSRVVVGAVAVLVAWCFSVAARHAWASRPARRCSGCGWSTSGPARPIGIGPRCSGRSILGRRGPADLRARPRHPGLDGRDGPRPAAPRLARPRDRLDRRRRPPGARGGRGGRPRPAPHRQPHRHAAGPARRSRSRRGAARAPRPAPTPRRPAAAASRRRPRRPSRAPEPAARARARARPSPAQRPSSARRQRPAPGARERAAPAGPARWRVTFDNGETFVVEGLALVGRRPEPRPGEPVRHLVPLPSGDMSLSKTHAQFQVAPDGDARRDGPRVHERLDPGPAGHVPRAGRRQAGHAARRRPGPVRRPADDGDPGVLMQARADADRPSFLDLLYDQAPLRRLRRGRRRGRARGLGE